MATYLVAGCAGFIGSRVTEKLLADGEAVIGIDNLNNAYDNRLKDWRLERLLTHKNFQFHTLFLRKNRRIDSVNAKRRHIDSCNQAKSRQIE